MTSTIFDHYGGFATIRKVVSSFYDRVLDSPVISHHFADVDMRRLIDHQTQFITFLMDGPGLNYTDDALRRVHQHLTITAEEFAEMVLLMRETLEDFDFSDSDIGVVVTRIEARESVIVGSVSPR